MPAHRIKPATGWYLHNFVGDQRQPGAGRKLLAAICADADRRSRTLYLDTSVPQLVDYYLEFGFEVVAEAPMAARGRAWTVFRMVRWGPIRRDG